MVYALRFSAEFHLFGFLMVLAAAITSGVRWTFSQTVMQRSQLGLENPVDFMFHIQPVMLLTLVPFLGALEGEQAAGRPAPDDQVLD